MPTPANPVLSSVRSVAHPHATKAWSWATVLLVAACGTDASGGGDVVSTADVALDGTAADAGADADAAASDTAVDPAPPPDVGLDGDASPPPDVGEPGAPCTVDSDCVDQFCANLVSGGGDGVCLARCQDDATCREGEDCLLLSGTGGEARVCVPRNYCQDADADGFGEGPGCVGRDCDDANPQVNPGADERCNGFDDNCNGRVDENPVDASGPCETGFVGVCSAGTLRCEGGAVACVQTTAVSAERCDGLDNDCDGRIDEDAGGRQTWWPDADGDGYGDPGGETREACDAPPGYASNSDDCDDEDANVRPGATELPGDGIDQDCDGQELCFVDADNDGYRTLPALRILTNNLACDGDGEADNTAPGPDCNDNNAAVFPNAIEVCNRVDDNCDGTIDEPGAIGERTYFRDADNDTYGRDDDTIVACFAPPGYVDRGGDCNDAAFNANPGLTVELCDGIDNTCDGVVDSVVRLCSTACGSGQELCTAGAWAGCTAPPVLPEVCDLADNDCDGTFDEGLSCRIAVHRKQVGTGRQWSVTPPAPPTCPASFDRQLYRSLYTNDPAEGPEWDTVQLGAYYLFNSSIPGVTPFYRCYNPNVDRFFLTMSPVCELWADASMVQGSLGYIATSQLPGTVPLYRGFQSEASVHVFTTDLAERDQMVNCQGFIAETIAGYVWPTP